TVAVDFTRLALSDDGWTLELERRRMSLYVDLLVQRLEAEATWMAAERRVVVAHSFGGMLALAWLLDGDRRAAAGVDGLVLVATTAGPMFDAARVLVARVGGHALRVPSTALLPLWNLRPVTRAVAALAGRGGTPGTVNFRALSNHSDLAVGLAGWRNTDWRARRSFRFAMAGFDVRSRLAQLHVRTIVLHGGRDSFFPVDVARELAGGIPRAELRIVPEAAHLLPLTHPEAVVRAVEDLLAP
ncbi:MAG TPA: alpha/beta hydrolase, partial [Gemmatimonadales bacterium]|nr:alpha/beta hydrolase [Gemmatimonadales bacterium]